MKEFGKLTADQFRELVQSLPDMFAMLRGVNERLASTPSTRFDSIMSGDYGDYNFVYEFPLAEHLSLLIIALGRHEDLNEIAASPDPQESVLEVLRHRDEIEDDKPQHEAFDDSEVIALCYSLSRTMQSMATYGRSISSLLQDVRDNNNHDSLFKAIRMDRTVIGCPTAMKHIAKAQIRDNKAFFKKLRSALVGPGNKQQAGLDLLRYAMLILRETGIKDVPEAELEELMVDKLGVYPKNQPNARKNIRAHYQWSQKIPTI